MATSNNKDLLDQSWQSVRGLIARALLADTELVPVPNLSTADYFGLFSVFVKNRSVSFPFARGLAKTKRCWKWIRNACVPRQETLSKKIKNSLAGPTYHVIGHVSQVIQLDKTDLDRLLNSASSHGEDINHSEKVRQMYIF